MNSVPLSPKIARAQAMDFAFNLSLGEMTMIFPMFPSINEGRNWEKRPREQQRAAMLWVLNRIFFASFGGLPIGDADPHKRRELLLVFASSRTSHLQECGWSMHDIMDWLLELRETTVWTDAPCDI